jgi:hypothetical protein
MFRKEVACNYEGVFWICNQSCAKPLVCIYQHGSYRIRIENLGYIFRVYLEIQGSNFTLGIAEMSFIYRITAKIVINSTTAKKYT